MHEGKRYTAPERTEMIKEVPSITEADLFELGITREAGAHLEHIQSLFERYPHLIEGARRNYHLFLRYAFITDYELMRARQTYGERGRRVDIGVIRAFVNNVHNPPSFLKGEERRVSERVIVMGDREGERRFGAEMVIGLQPDNSTKKYASNESGLILVFSLHSDDARSLWNNGASIWEPVDGYRFDGLYFEDSAFDSLKQPLEHAVRNGNADELTFEGVMKMIECLTPKPDADVSVAEYKIDELCSADGKSREEIEVMKQAIKAFATFQKPAPTTGEQCFGEIGRCLTAPHTFNIFLARNFGIKDVDTDSYGSSLGGYHQVNVWGNVCIDWTARQFSELRETEYPYVYHIDTPHHLGLPYSKWSEERKQEVREMEDKERRGTEY